MNLIFNSYLAGLSLGAVHAIEVDHMVAVSVFTGLKPKLKAAIGYGARWGLGHALVVVLVGAALAWLEVKVPDSIIGWGEVLVGISLIVLGIWAWRKAKLFHTHLPKEHSLVRTENSDDALTVQEILHGHLHAHNGQVLQHGHHHSHNHHSNNHHSHNNGTQRHHQHLPTAMGALHGLAGSAPVLALVPVTLLASFHQALIYLILFSIGTTLSMMLYAGLAAIAIQSLGLTHKHVVRLTTGIAVATVVVGMWWVVSAAFLRL